MISHLYPNLIYSVTINFLISLDQIDIKDKDSAIRLMMAFFRYQRTFKYNHKKSCLLYIRTQIYLFVKQSAYHLCTLFT